MPVVRDPSGVLVVGRGDMRCSGVLLMEDGVEGAWVLTSGAALQSKLFRETPIAELPFARLLYPSSPSHKKIKFSVVLERTRSSTTAAADNKLNATGKDVPLDWPPINVCKAYVAAMWRCPLITKTLATLLEDWELSASEERKTDAVENGDDAEDRARSTLPLFLVLRIRNTVEESFTPRGLVSGAYSVLSALLRRLEANGMGGGRKDGRWWRGRRLLLESCPFANTVFFNAWTEGLAAGATGPQGCILMADIRAAPGCEGAPVFLLSESTPSLTASPDRRAGPVAMTVAAMSWWRGEWVGFTLLAALPPVLRRVVNGGNSAPAAPLMAPSTGKKDGDDAGGDVEAGAAAAAEAAVVLVRCGGDWGSGVAVALPGAREDRPTTRLVLTCSHVVRHAPEPGLAVGEAHWGMVGVWWRGRRLPARLLFRSPANEAFDVAVLQLLECDSVKELPSALPLASTSPSKGDRIMCAGFPVLPDTAETGPLVTGGRVAKVIPRAMLQASCIAQSGASGGALLRPCAGGEGVEVVGVVVSNIRDDRSGMLFPHFCLATPSDALYTPLCAFMKSADVTTLKALTSDNVAIQRMWHLQVPHSCNFAAPLAARL